MNHRSSTNPLGERGSLRLLRWLASIAIGLCFVFVLAISPAAAAPGPEPDRQAPNVDPTRCGANQASVSAEVGETVSIDLYVQDVTNLYGTDMRVSFDPTIGQVVDQDPCTWNPDPAAVQLAPPWLRHPTGKPTHLRISRRIVACGASGMRLPKHVPPRRHRTKDRSQRLPSLVCRLAPSR